MSLKRFDIITEADARVLDPGSTVILAPRGHVTPLAADTLRERRVTVISDDPGTAASISFLLLTSADWRSRATIAGSR